MAEMHAEFALGLDPTCEARLVRLWTWSPDVGAGGAGSGGPAHDEADVRTEIFDPIGGSLETFRECRDLIDASLRAWLPSQVASRRGDR